MEVYYAVCIPTTGYTWTLVGSATVDLTTNDRTGYVQLTSPVSMPAGLLTVSGQEQVTQLYNILTVQEHQV